MIDARVVFLTHYIPLYQVRVLQSIAAAVRDFHVLLSTPIEPNRDFTPDWTGLNVTVQDTWTLRRRWKHQSGGFDDPLYVHVPYDTTRRLRELKPDVVMSLELGARSAGAALYCRRNPETKLVLCTYMSERTEEGRGWVRRQLRKRLVRAADAITYNGPSCLQYLKQFDVNEDALFHLPYAADDRTVYQGPLDREDNQTRHRLLIVGQLSDRKGVMPLLRQAADYCQRRPNRRIELVFAGDGPLRHEIQAHVYPANLDVNLLGNMTPDDLAVWMLRCGAMVAPTLADEWMLVVNEGLQAGLPVLGSIHSQAVTALIQEGINGWQYDPMDDSSLAFALDCYFGESADSLASMRTTARRSVEQRTPDWAASGGLNAIRHVLGAANDSEIEQPSDVASGDPSSSLLELGGNNG